MSAKFARPWMWREPSMAPLYATGSEFAWRETAWAQGSTVGASKAIYDVPLFVRAVREMCTSEAFASWSDEEQIEALFGRGADSPATGIGRYCSLNLRRLTSYGTLEFRRFQGTLDEALISRWAHFCVAFVECFRRGPGGARLLDPGADVDAELEALARAQETATAADLMAEMKGFVDERTASYFMADSGASAQTSSVTIGNNPAAAERATAHVL